MFARRKREKANVRGVPKARNKWESLIFFLDLQSHHYIGVFRTASLTKRDTEKEGQMSEK